MQATIQLPRRRRAFFDAVMRFPERGGACGAVVVVISIRSEEERMKSVTDCEKRNG